MDVVSFMSLFLGLTAGVQPVQVAVTEPVASVEIRLDGHTLGVMRGAPWRVTCDFGTVLQPHKLEAVAFDSKGTMLGTCRQFVNLPRRDAEATIALDHDNGGHPVSARVSWDNLEFRDPRSIFATLDGTPLTAAAPGFFPLPSLAKNAPHFLAVKVQFPRDIVATAEIVFGGPNAEAATADITALPVVPKNGSSIPSLEQLAGTIAREGTPLRVVGIEEGPAEVVVVCDASAGGPVSWPELRHAISREKSDFGVLGKDDGVRFMIPLSRPRVNRGRSVHLFDISQRFTASDGGIPRLMITPVSKWLTSGPQSIADAVAVAGLYAASDNRRRAVAVLLGTAGDEHSTYSIATVRNYLGALHVPLVVWSTLRPKAKRAVKSWGPPEDISSPGAMERAIARLRSLLEAQRIVWVEGRHLPQEITLAATATFALAGSEQAAPEASTH